MKMNRLLLNLMLLLTGCAVGGQPVDVPLLEAPLTAKGPSVIRFEDGRKGFLLAEKAELPTALRDDFTRSVELLAGGQLEQAVRLLESVVASRPKVTAPYINLAIAYRQLGQSDQAEEQLKKALELFPGHPLASNEYGLLLRQAGRFAEARIQYEQALAGFPEYLPSRRNLGILCDLYVQDPGCALAQFEQYRLDNPEDQQVKIWLAELRLRLGQPRE